MPSSSNSGPTMPCAALDPKVTKAALDAILRKLADRRIAVLLAGMQAPRNLGPEYARDFDAIYPALASTHPVVFYPFFLDGVAADSKLNQATACIRTPPASTRSWRVSCRGSKNWLSGRALRAPRDWKVSVMPRLFTGVEIPPMSDRRLATLRGGLPGARWIDPENYHLTLRFIGDVDDIDRT